MLSVISSLLLLRVFFRKIKQILKFTTRSNSIETKHGSSQAQKTNLRFTKIIAKLSCLVLCSMMTTLLSIALIINSSIHDNMAMAGLISLIASSLDIAVNSICLVLYWPYADRWYQRICKVCDRYMMNRCTRKVNDIYSRAASTTVSAISSKQQLAQTQIHTTSPGRSVESSIIINSTNKK